MAIGFREFNEQEFRQSLQQLSDDELVKMGKQLRRLSGDGKIVSPTPSTFDKELKLCREEWRKRHAK